MYNSILFPKFHVSHVNYFLITIQLKELSNDNGLVLHQYVWSIEAEKVNELMFDFCFFVPKIKCDTHLERTISRKT